MSNQNDADQIASLSSVRNAHQNGDETQVTPVPAAAETDATQKPIAIISDIHGNLEALTVVMEEIRRRNVTSICCLGDVIGYGPNPLECLDTVIENCEFTIMGNHDFAIFYEPFNFNTAAEYAA